MASITPEMSSSLSTTCTWLPTRYGKAKKMIRLPVRLLRMDQLANSATPTTANTEDRNSETSP